jgi:hypothetical protein
MTMATRPISHYLAPALLVAGASLAAANWFVQPGRAAAWASALLVFGCMTVAYILALRSSKRDAAPRSGGEAITNAIVFAGFIMAISLGAKLAATLGAVDPDADLTRRITMAVTGTYLMFMGNALPKTLTPLSALRCDGARMQAFQRFSGWTWVLTGGAYAVAWIVLPIDLAKPVSVAIIAGGMLAIVMQLVRLRWTRREA